MFSRIDKAGVVMALAFGAVTTAGSVPAVAQGADTATTHAQGTADAHAHKPIDRAEARIAEIHDKLHITAAQDPQWTAFVQAERDSAKEMSELIHQREEHAKTMNAVDDFRSYAKIAEAHEDGLKKILPAFEALYGSLSDEQKKAADTMFRNPS